MQQLTYRAGVHPVTWGSTPRTIAWNEADRGTSWLEAPELGPPGLPVLVVDPADVVYAPVWQQTLTVENIVTVGYGDQQAVTVDEPARSTPTARRPARPSPHR